MLIPSHRHTPEDLRLWREYEEADLLRGIAEWKIQSAIDSIGRFTEKGSAYCAVSWGKDSVVVAHLCARAAYATRLGHLIITATTSPNPDNATTRDIYLSITKQDYIEAIGRLDIQHDFDSLAVATGTARYISGVRAEESGTRSMSRAVHGVSTDNACRPIIDWSVNDVYSYLAIHSLPVHPAYAMLGGGRWERCHIRVSSLGGKRGSRIGRAEWEREYYGDILRRLESRT